MTNCYCKTPIYLDTVPDNEKSFKSIDEDEIQLDRMESGQKYSKFFSKLSFKVQNQDLLTKGIISQKNAEPKGKALSFINNSPAKVINRKSFLKNPSELNLNTHNRSQKSLKNSFLKVITDRNTSSSKNQSSSIKNKREYDVTVPNPSVAEPSSLKLKGHMSPGERLGIQVLNSVRTRSDSPKTRIGKNNLIEKIEKCGIQNEDWVKLSLDFPSKTFVPNIFTDVVTPSFNKLKKIIAEEDRKNKILPGKDYSMNDIIQFNKLTQKIKGMEKLSSFYLSKFKEAQYLMYLAQIARNKFMPHMKNDSACSLGSFGSIGSFLKSSKNNDSKRTTFSPKEIKEPSLINKNKLSSMHFINNININNEKEFSTPLKNPDQRSKMLHKDLLMASQIKNSGFNRQNSSKIVGKIPRKRIYQNIKPTPNKIYVQLKTKNK